MMLYGIIRIVFWSIAFAFAWFLLKKSKIVRKKIAAILIFASCLILGTISCLFPVENLFINFKSPEDVLHYYQNGRVDDFIYGNNSCMIIYSEGSKLGGHFIVPKSAKGYEIPSFLSVKRISHRLDSNGDFKVYHVVGTDDYYIVGMTVSIEKDINIVDCNNNKVKSIIVKNGDADDSKTVFIFSFVKHFTNEHYILINGGKISITN